MGVRAREQNLLCKAGAGTMSCMKADLIKVVHAAAAKHMHGLTHADTDACT